MNKLLGELRRRNVFRVATTYLVIGWLIVQVVDTLSRPLGLPDWILTLVFIILATGFPVVVVSSWTFDLTDNGVEHTDLADPDQQPAVSSASGLNIVLISALAIALGYFIWESRFSSPLTMVDTQANTSQTPDPAAFRLITDKSIAVLPFDDFSPDADQGWFVNGLSEEIVNALVRTADLKVASRTSSFAFRRSDRDASEIASLLGVAHILEGQVRRFEGRLRVTAQLIRASDGIHLWSDTYDRSTEDAIAIQEDLAINISKALQTAMDPQALAAMQGVGTRSIAAYNAYLQGLSYEPRCVTDYPDECLASYVEAIRLDPLFAEARFRLATYWSNYLDVTLIRPDPGLSYEHILSRFQEQVSEAIRYSSNPVDALKYRALQAQVDLRLRDFHDLVIQYLEQRPNDREMLSTLIRLELDLQYPREAVEQIEKFLTLMGPDNSRLPLLIISSYRAADFDLATELSLRAMRERPTDRLFLYQAQRALLWSGELAQAAEAARLYRISPTSPVPLLAEAYRDLLVDIRQACAENRTDDANRLFETLAPKSDQEPGYDRTLHWLTLKTLGRDEDAELLLQIYNNSGSILPLYSFINYPQFDPGPFPFLMQIIDREAIIKEVTPVPFACVNPANDRDIDPR